MLKNSTKILFTLAITVILSYSIMSNLILSLTLLFLGIVLFFISQQNTLHRKENLNIIRDEEKLYFYLSDDLLFSVNLSPNRSFSETLHETIDREMNTLEKITRKICFINFQNQSLLKEVNQTLHQNALSIK